MMRRVRMRAVGVLVVLALAVALSPAAAQEELTEELARDVTLQPLRRPIHVPPGEGTRWVEVIADVALLDAAAPELADVRVVDGTGRVIPSIVLSPSIEEAVFVSLTEVAIAFGPDEDGPASGPVALPRDRGTEDLVIRVRAHDAQVARIQGRTGDGTWQELRSAPPPELRQDPFTWPYGRPHTRPSPLAASPTDDVLLVHLGTSPHEEIRVVLNGPTAPSPGTLEILDRRMRPLGLEPVPVVTHDAGYRGRTYTAIVEVTGPARPVSGVVLDGDQLPHLTTTVDIRPPDGSMWQRVASLSPEGDRLTWPPTWTRTLRLRVDGGSPPTPPVTVLQAEAAPLRIGVELDAEVEAWIVYGDAHTDPATWTFDPLAIRRALPAIAVLGDPEPSPWFEPPRAGLEWVERHPAAITATMVALLVVLAGLVLRWHPPASTDDDPREEP